MKYLDLNGKQHIYNFKKICREAKSPSTLHVKARELLKKKLPSSSIYEEVSLLGLNLVADFFIPDLGIMVEVHGEQHYKFIKRFHKTQAGFRASRMRDAMKQEWCDLNQITYIELPFDQVENWASIIDGFIK